MCDAVGKHAQAPCVRLLQVDRIFRDDFFVESGRPQHAYRGTFGAGELIAIDVHLGGRDDSLRSCPTSTCCPA